jgi:predicted glycosyltransferase
VTGGRADAMAGPRFLLYSHDGFGLGHLQRNFNIARALVRQVAGASALLVGGSPHGFDCRLPAGVDWIKLPSIVKHAADGWRPRTLVGVEERVRRLRAAMLAGVVEQFRPHVMVVDHLPTGVWGELLPILAGCRRDPAAPRLVLGLRDVLDRPEVTRRVWLQNGGYQALAAHYQRVLVYGDEAVFATADVYGLAACVPGRVAYCGYVGPAAVRRAAVARLRAEVARPEETLIVVSGGGGADAHPLLAACAGALRRLAARWPLRAILVGGPLMPERQRLALRRRVAGLPVEVWWQVEELPALLGAADLVISMAGYNTLVEAIGLRHRPLVAPRPGPSGEQSLRAAAFARRGLIDLLPPDELSPAGLAAAIERRLRGAGATAAARRPRCGGLRVVVREIEQLLAAPAAREGTAAAAVGSRGRRGSRRQP